jgi:hypothetical protein
MDSIFSMGVLAGQIKLFNKILEDCQEEKKCLIIEKIKEINDKFKLVRQSIDLGLTSFDEYHKRIDDQNEFILKQIQNVKDDVSIQYKDKLLSMLENSAKILFSEKIEIVHIIKEKVYIETKVKIDEYIKAANYFKEVVLNI